MAALHQAAQAGDLKRIKTLKLFDINKRDPDGKTVLFYASSYNHLDIVKYLLEHNADVNMLNSGEGSGALLQASANGHTDMVDYLLQCGAAVNLANNQKSSPLSEAAYYNCVDTVICLLKYGADVNQSDETKNTPVWWGASQGNLDIVTYLVQAGANVNIADDDQRTPILVASQEGHAETVSYLCQHGAHLDIPIRDGRTPLFFACQYHHTDIVQCLLQHGADADLQDVDGDSSLHILARLGFKKIVKLLLHHKVKMTNNKDGDNALDIAKLMQYEPMPAGVNRTDFYEIISMLEEYQVHCDEAQQKQGNSGSMHAKNQIEKVKTESCIIDKDILQSPILQNLAVQKAKAEENVAAEMIRGKMNDEDEYLKGLWAEINNVGKEIKKPKKVKEDQGLSDQHLLTLGKEMEQDWKMIGGFLGLRHSEIKKLDAEHKSEPTYAAWSMLVAWRDAGGMSGDGAGEKRQQLMSVLVQMGRQDIVDLMSKTMQADMDSCFIPLVAIPGSSLCPLQAIMQINQASGAGR